MVKVFSFATLSLFIGVVSGLLSSFFLHSLNFVTALRLHHPWLILGLPVFGFFFGLLLKKIPPDITQGLPGVLRGEKRVSVLTAPFIFLASLLTHLFGGSAGREGVGVLMGASASHVLVNIHPRFALLKDHLIYGGMAAGFASIFGTPLAGFFFAFELYQFKKIKEVSLVVTTLGAAILAQLVTHLLGPDHSVFLVLFNWDFSLVPQVLIIALLSALGALVFYEGMKFCSRFVFSFTMSPEWKLFAGGALVSVITLTFDLQEYSGIGVETIERSFLTTMDLEDFWLKWLLTILTLSVGFKGGEVTPLFFMGATLANSVLNKMSYPHHSLHAGLGMVSLFAAATKTPVAGAIMGAELFGLQVLPLSLVCCFLSSHLFKDKSIYNLS